MASRCACGFAGVRWRSPILHGKVDFLLAFAVVHEFSDAERFFAEVAEATKPGTLLLLAEPAGHVNKATFEMELAAAVKEDSSKGATNDSKEPNGITKRT